jgi:hypothetical protein
VRFAGLAAVPLIVSLSLVAFGQAPPAAAPAGQGGQRGQAGQGAVGQGLAGPPGTANANAAANNGRGQGGGNRGGAAGGRGAAAGPVEPTPRWPDGHPRLGAVPGQKGLWNGGGTTADATTPYQDWARAVSQVRRDEAMEPHTRCKPSGGPRQFLTPYGVDFTELPELQRVFIMDVGGPHTFRTIYTDGRQHPKDLAPSYYGHSIGKWEGDTFVVDTVGFNERIWIDRGQAPHTEKLHLIEKFTRTDMNTMTYDLTVDDPGAYTATWSKSSSMRFSATAELFEYVCQDNNYAPELLVGTGEHVDRSSVIVP